MRYVGQSYELTVPLPAEQLDPSKIDRVLEQFHIEHDRAYGYSAPTEPVEFVNLRLTAIGKIAKPRLHELEGNNTDIAAAQKATRSVYFAESDGYVECPIYDRYHPGAQLRLDRTGNRRGDRFHHSPPPRLQCTG